MTIHLYQRSGTEIFNFCRRTLLKLGFSLHLTDEKKGIISGSKRLGSSSHCLFFDVRLRTGKNAMKVTLISNQFSGNTGTFHADAVSEELFLENFQDLLHIQPPDNPLKLTQNDYALAVGF